MLDDHSRNADFDRTHRPKLQTPTIGRIVIYRSRTGSYALPAIIVATTNTVNPKGVEAGNIPALSSPWHVHLVVFSPGNGVNAPEEIVAPSPHGLSTNFGGTYPEFDVPFSEITRTEPGEPETRTWEDDNVIVTQTLVPQPAGSWAWPVIR